MLIQNQVGPVATTASAAPGSLLPGRVGQLGDSITSELHGRYYETNYRRNLFNAANQAGVVTTVGLATTYTGLCLSNPVGSTINVVLNKIGYTFVVVFAAVSAIGLMAGYNSGTNVTHTIAGVTHSLFFGAGALGQALVDTSATLPTAPFVTHIFGAGLTGAVNLLPSIGPTFVDLEGGLLLPPGAYAAMYTSTVSGAASMFASFVWEEIPI